MSESNESHWDNTFLHLILSVDLQTSNCILKSVYVKNDLFQIYRKKLTSIERSEFDANFSQIQNSECINAEYMVYKTTCSFESLNGHRFVDAIPRIRRNVRDCRLKLLTAIQDSQGLNYLDKYDIGIVSL